MNSILVFRPQTTVQFSSNSIQNCDRRSDDRHTHRQRDARDLIICPMLCYSNGTDKDVRTSLKQNTRIDWIVSASLIIYSRRVEKHANDAETVSGVLFSFISRCATGLIVDVSRSRTLQATASSKLRSRQNWFQRGLWPKNHESVTKSWCVQSEV